MTWPRKKAKRAAPPPAATVYPYDLVLAEIVRVIEGMDRGGKKAVADALGIHPPVLSKRLKGRKFSIEELGRLVHVVRDRGRRPPPGWPFLTYSAWEQVRAAILAEAEAPPRK